MIQSLYSAAAGMAAQQTGIDLIANNLANANTTGYKAVRGEFADLLYQQMAPASADVGAGARLASTQRDFRPGTLNRTENPLDLAIAGAGFFHLKRADGSDVYTRDGAFSVDGQGRVVSRDGMLLQGDTGPISIPVNAPGLMIKSDGSVLYQDAANKDVLAGRIALTTFTNPAGLAALGDNLYAATAAAGAATVGTAGSAERGRIEQGALEASNVQVVQEMIGLIVAQRTYELNSKAVQSSDDMLGIANNLRR